MSTARQSKGLARMDCIVRSHSPLSPTSQSRLPVTCPASDDSDSPLEWLEALPTMAFIERGTEIWAANTLARDFIGTGVALQTNQLFIGIYPAAIDGMRQRFECQLLPPGGRPTTVWGATQPFAAAGSAARLVLLMESDAAVAGGSPDDGCEGERTFLEDLFDSSPEAMVIVQGTRIVRANLEFQRMFGISIEDCLGDTLFDLIIPEGRHHESEILLHGVAVSGHASMETVRRTGLGEDLDVSISVARVRLWGDSVGFAVTYRDIRAQKQAEARLQHSALHDPLTGLANRALFLDRLSLTMARFERRQDRDFAVVFLDVDRFKLVNDSYGHAAGDALLLAVTERLRACLRPQDTIARFGGDEFALLLDDVGAADDIAEVVGRIQNAIQKPVDVGGVEVFVSASMGITLSGDGRGSVDEIMQRADQAMYVAKANGKGRHKFYSGPGAAAELEPGLAEAAALEVA